MESTRVVIIGAGPAGIAAAIQLQRYGLDPLIFERKHIGGLLVNAHWVENYPGFPDGISGLDLVDLMEVHLRRMGINVIFDDVTEVGTTNDRFVVQTSSRRVQAQQVILASGTKPKEATWVRIAREARDKTFYEVYPIRGARGRRIVIIGAGDAAFDYALGLGMENDVTIVNRRAEPRCLHLLWERARACPRITYLPNTGVTRIVSAQGDQLDVCCTSRDSECTVSAHYVLFAVGREPELGCLPADLPALADDRSTPVRNSLEGKGGHRVVHLIGDVRTGILRQAAIAVGDGIMAAMRINAQLQED